MYPCQIGTISSCVPWTTYAGALIFGENSHSQTQSKKDDRQETGQLCDPTRDVTSWSLAKLVSPVICWLIAIARSSDNLEFLTYAIWGFCSFRASNSDLSESTVLYNEDRKPEESQSCLDRRNFLLNRERPWDFLYDVQYPASGCTTVAFNGGWKYVVASISSNSSSFSFSADCVWVSLLYNDVVAVEEKAFVFEQILLANRINPLKCLHFMWV